MKVRKVMGIVFLGLLLVSCGTSEGSAASTQPIENTVGYHQVFATSYETSIGEFGAGTSFVVQPDYCETPILLTAHHIFGPSGGLDNQLTSEEISDFIDGGKLYDMFSFEENPATIDQGIVIAGAKPIPDIDKDLAAFTLKNTQDLKPLVLAKQKPSNTEKLYLIAGLSEEFTGEMEFYEADVIRQTDKEVYYLFKDDIKNFSGSSGGPVVNRKGEVVAMHLGSGEQLGKPMGVGIKSTHINNTLKKAYK